MSIAFACEVCSVTSPAWRIVRDGDVATSWACALHLSQVCDRMQRDWEVTRLIVTCAPKAGEWAEISSALDGIGS